MFRTIGDGDGSISFSEFHLYLFGRPYGSECSESIPTMPDESLSESDYTESEQELVLLVLELVGSIRTLRLDKMSKSSSISSPIFAPSLVYIFTELELKV